MPQDAGWAKDDAADFTFDGSSAVGQVRALASETAAQYAMVTDGEINVHLVLNGSDVRLAAAAVLDSKAAFFIQREGKRTVGMGGDSQERTDGTAMAQQMRAIASELRRQVYEDGSAFDIVEMVPNQFAFQERLFNQWLRSESGPPAPVVSSTPSSIPSSTPSSDGVTVDGNPVGYE